ncbi:glucose 1-dehydrogenase [Gordonia sp. HNM0687]|uniref:Glucose 1-dehydrogenase n=1 Tax=Gordonia mangrovi TaxID=2665643 RepID=A0A6L7GU42_9ACTN|nr:SDR family oxidoreductase [Gordonia mangrovi]MXP23534.1 glucose 1-dehydrogenase [Gordonia mangrovi]UVF76571.1 SDR family oxidoreductase [Gordonia mangrovi]
MELGKKTALVTGAGATGGIGFQIAAALRQAGARVILSGRNEERGRAAAAELGDDVQFITADVTDIDSVRRLADQAGPVDILVNNAASATAAPTTDQSVDAFDAEFATNVRGPFFLTAALAPHMIAQGGGSIINVSSLVARHGTPNMSVYGASKAALESLTRSWAAEFAHAGVRVNTVAPGATGSQAVVEAMGENLDLIAQSIPMGRIGKTTDVADAVVFLASDRAGFITGALLPVDGGRAAV